MNRPCFANFSFGNITYAPLFVDYAGGNLRLQSNSPCINAGNSSYLTNACFCNCLDLDDNPRIVKGTVDMGAYEFQGPDSLISYAWLQQYGLPTDGSVDATDLDADGHTTWQEWRCQTCPTNALSVLRVLSATPDGTNVTLSWQSVAGVSYFVERSFDLSGATASFALLATNIPGQPGTTAYTDTNATAVSRIFYRVGVPQLHEKKVEAVFTDALKAHLAKHGFDPIMGARPMARLIQDTIRSALADELLFGKLANGGRVTVDVGEDEKVQLELFRATPAVPPSTVRKWLVAVL